MLNGVLRWCLLAVGLGFCQNVDFASYIPWRQTDSQPGVHDPTVIRDDRGTYTLMSTNNLLAVSQSTDMASWSSKAKLLSGVPTWMTAIYAGITDIWAPHLSKMGGRYWVYYCGSVFGKNTSLIGAMWSPTLDVTSPAYKWTDIGEVWRSTAANDYNAIDPEILVDGTGKAWLSFGSFWQGLRMIAIDPSTGKQLAANKTLYKTASRGGGALEGPSTIQHGGWTYLFTPFDKCCDGVNSTYRTMYGRSQSPTGPYLDEAGKDMVSGGGTQLLWSYGRYVGLGGGSPFHDGRRDYFALHYYDRARNGASYLQLREIVYGDDGWLELGQPFLGRHLALEAEHAVLTGDSILAATGTAASNNEYVGYINGANSSVEFLTNAFQAETYAVVVRYAAGDGASSQKLSVNGATPTTVAYPKTAAWGTFPAGQVVVLDVALRKGRNSLKFTKGDGFAELDRIDLVRHAGSVLRLGGFDKSPNSGYDSASDALVLGASSSATYENVGFDSGAFKSVELCAISGTGRVKLSLAASTSPSEILDVSGKGCQTFDLGAAFQTTKGIQDLVVANVTGDLVLESLRFQQSSTGVARPETARPLSPQRRPFDVLGRLDRNPYPYGAGRLEMVP